MNTNIKITIKKIFVYAYYAVNMILFPPAKVIFIILTFCLSSSYISNRILPSTSDLFGILIGYVVCCGMADLIYFLCRKKYLTYKLKITQKHMEHLKSLMKEIDPQRYTEKYGNNVEIKNDIKNQSSIVDINKDDSYFKEAALLAVKRNNISIGFIQRTFKIGFNQAARIMDQLEAFGVVGPEEGTKPRRIIMDEEMLKYKLSKLDSSPTSDALQNNANYYPGNNDRIDLYNSNFDYMTGPDFEQFCADILRKNGFYNVDVTKVSGDQGIDVLATKGGVKYGIQCKCYTSDIGNKAVQEAYSGASFYGCHVAVVLTNRYFTKSAIELAEKNNVLLWNRDELIKMIDKANR